MTARKNRKATDAEEYREYRLRESIERGEKIAGSDADWLDRFGPAARVARRVDADRRHAKPKGRAAK